MTEEIELLDVLSGQVLGDLPSDKEIAREARNLLVYQLKRLAERSTDKWLRVELSEEDRQKGIIGAMSKEPAPGPPVTREEFCAALVNTLHTLDVPYILVDKIRLAFRDPAYIAGPWTYDSLRELVQDDPEEQETP
jgi:hypothetical protein